jgi:crotonobetainyl-CoA dehydrogenase
VFDFTETENQKLIVKSVKEFCERYLTTEKIREMDDKGHPYPKDVAEGLCSLGIVMGTVPMEHGGSGIDWITQGMIAEVIGYYQRRKIRGYRNYRAGWRIGRRRF